MSETPDIVEKLRARATSYRAGGPSSEHTATMLDDAANEITRLRSALAARTEECARVAERFSGGSSVAAAIRALPTEGHGQWRGIASVPPHKDVLFFRPDAGVWCGQFTNCGSWMSEEEMDGSEYDEATLWDNDFWFFDQSGAHRCDGDLKPTHWMPLPSPPSEKEGG